MNQVLKDLRWRKLPVLDDGFVCLVDVMGDDYSVVQAARISYGNDNRDASKLEPPDKECGSYAQTYIETIRKDDRQLIRYMMRNHHGTPFEMAEVKLLVRVPMDTWRQWIRHRTMSVNEYSTRYSEAIDSAQTTESDEWRLQSQSNKQGSQEGALHWPVGYGITERVEEDYEAETMHFRHTDRWHVYRGGVANPEGMHEVGYPVLEVNKGCSPADYLSIREGQLQELARDVYEERLKFGVAREQARKDLPLSTYTEAYVKFDLRNMLHFLGLRMDSHAQKEIRDYATIIGEQIIKPLFPLTWEAFVDYQLESMQLSRLDIAAIKFFTTETRAIPRIEYTNGLFRNKREREECLDKLTKLGFIKPE